MHSFIMLGNNYEKTRAQQFKNISMYASKVYIQSHNKCKIVIVNEGRESVVKKEGRNILLSFYTLLHVLSLNVQFECVHRYKDSLNDLK